MPDQDKKATGMTRLLDEFPVSSYEEWRAKAQRLLKGASFEKRMLTLTPEGITLQPLYRKEDVETLAHLNSYPGFSPFIRGSRAWNLDRGGWAVAQEITTPSADEFNKALLHGLERGQDTVNLPLDNASRLGLDPDQAQTEDVGHGGVSIACADDLDTALKDVDLATVPVYLQTGASGMPFLGLYVTVAKRRGVATQDLTGAVAMDPLGEWVLRGRLTQSIKWAFISMKEMTNWAMEHAPKLGTIWAHGEPYQFGGAHAVQELGFTLATAVEYLRQMELHGLTPDQVVPYMRFSFGLGSHLFTEVAKLRAARVLWDRILDECGIESNRRTMWIHAQTSRYNKTLYDPYVNMLRTTTEAFSGVVGGVNSMHVSPFDAALRVPDAFSRRIARNTHTILRDEAHLSEVLDPAGGSWYVEKLTFEIIERAWDLFTDVEKLGGMVEALQKGMPQQEVAQTAEVRRKRYAVRKDVFVGTNRYPNATEEKLAERAADHAGFHEKRSRKMQDVRTSSAHQQEITVIEKLATLMNADAEFIAEAVIDAVEHGATIGEIVRSRTHDESDRPEITPIPQIRASEPFEVLRTAVANHRQTSDGCKVFLATLGSVGKYMPRLDFSAQFFELGGFEVLRTTGFSSPEEAVEETKKSGAAIVVICGLDDVYPEQAPAVAQGIKESNPDTSVVLAGQPADPELIQTLKDAGVDLFIHIKSDVLAILTDLARKQGVEL